MIRRAAAELGLSVDPVDAAHVVGYLIRGILADQSAQHVAQGTPDDLAATLPHYLDDAERRWVTTRRQLMVELEGEDGFGWFCRRHGINLDRLHAELVARHPDQAGQPGWIRGCP